jgi:putative tricarboxylic transport membrane protein
MVIRPYPVPPFEEVVIKEDRIASASFFVLGILVIVESLNLSFGGVHSPGPGFIPFFLGLSMAGLSLLCFFSPDLQLPGDAFWNSWAQGHSIVLIFAALTVYLILFNLLGFCLDTFLLMIFLAKAAGAKGYKSSLLLSLVTMVVIYIVFYKMLIIPFPVGILGI